MHLSWRRRGELVFPDVFAGCRGAIFVKPKGPEFEWHIVYVRIERDDGGGDKDMRAFG